MAVSGVTLPLIPLRAVGGNLHIIGALAPDLVKGGWEAESTIEYFRRYAAYVTEQLGSELRCIRTINEDNMGLQLAAIAKRFRLMAEQAAKAQANNAKKAEGTV